MLANYRAGLAAAQYVNAHNKKGKPVSPLDYFKFQDGPNALEIDKPRMHPAAANMMAFTAAVKGREQARGKS